MINDNPISNTDKIITEAPVRYIDVELGNNKTDSDQIIPGLFSKVDQCNTNIYNNCNFTE
jgi:hypothetical protein